MMRKITTLVGLPIIALLLIVSSCREEKYDIPTPAPVGDTGGHAKIIVTPQHHGSNVNEARIFIEYNATSPQPDTGDYDRAVDGPVAVFDSLKPGDYYIFALASHDSLNADQYNVYGGATFKIVDTLPRTYNLYLNVDNPWHHQDL